MEFVYSKVGINAFAKVRGLNEHDPLVENAYEYVFNKDTADKFLLRLNLVPETIAFIESGNF
jgi:hypothetical protein